MGVLSSSKNNQFSTQNDEKKKKSNEALSGGGGSSKSALNTSQAANPNTALKGTGTAQSTFSKAAKAMRDQIVAGPVMEEQTPESLISGAIEQAKEKIETGQAVPKATDKTSLRERLSQIMGATEKAVASGTIDLAKVNTKDADSTFVQTVQAYNSEKQKEARQEPSIRSKMEEAIRGREAIDNRPEMGETPTLRTETVADAIQKDATNINEPTVENAADVLANRDLAGFNERIGTAPQETQQAGLGDLAGGGSKWFGGKASSTFDQGSGNVNPTLSGEADTLGGALRTLATAGVVNTGIGKRIADSIGAYLNPGNVRESGSKVVQANPDGTSPKGLSVGDTVIANNEERRIAGVNSDGSYRYEKMDGLGRMDKDILSKEEQSAILQYQSNWREAKKAQRELLDLAREADEAGDHETAEQARQQANIADQEAEKAHQTAESIRKAHGYTGGSTGAGYKSTGNYVGYDFDEAPGQVGSASMYPERAFLNTLLKTNNKNEEDYAQKQKDIINQASMDMLNDPNASKYSSTNVGILAPNARGNSWGTGNAAQSTIAGANYNGPIDDEVVRQMNFNDRKTYNYLYNKYGEDRAREYLDALSYTFLNENAAKAEQQKIQEFANEHPVLGFGLSAVGNTYIAPIGTAQNTAQTIENWAASNLGIGEYKPIDENSLANRQSMFGSQVRSDIEQNIKTGNENVDKVLRFAYEAGGSLADMALAMTTTGYFGLPSKTVTTVLASNSAQQTWNDSLARGATQEQAAMNAFANGMLEYLSETPAVEGWFSMRGSNSPVKDINSFVKNFFKQGVVEFGGESVANVTQTAADQAIMGNRSDYAMNVQNNMANGMDADEARRKAAIDLYVMETLKAGAQGMLMGGVMGVGATGINIRNSNRGAVEGKSIDAEGRTIRNYSPIVRDIAQTAKRINDFWGEGEGLDKKYIDTADKILSGDKVGAVKLANLKGAIQEHYQNEADNNIESIYKYVGLDNPPTRMALSLGRFTGADETGYQNTRFTNAWILQSRRVLTDLLNAKTFHPETLQDPNSEIRKELDEYMGIADTLLYAGYLTDDAQNSGAVRAEVNKVLNDIPASAAGNNPISNDDDYIYEDQEPEAELQEETPAEETAERIVEAVEEEPTAAEATERVLAEEAELMEEAEPQSERTQKGPLEEIAPEPTQNVTEPSVIAEDVAEPQTVRTPRGTVEQATPQQTVSNEAVNQTAEPTAPTTGKVARTEVTRADRSNAEASTETQSGKKNTVKEGIHVSQIESQPKSVRDAINKAQRAIKEPMDSFDVVRYNPDSGTVTLYEVDDFNGKPEPEIVRKVTVYYGGSVKDELSSGTIIPEKSMYVSNDYTGFDVAEQRRRENYWRSRARSEGIRYDGSQLSDKMYFYQKFEELLMDYEAEEEANREAQTVAQPVTEVTEVTEETTQAPENIIDAIADPEVQEIFNEDVNDRLMDEIEQKITDEVDAEEAEDEFYDLADQVMRELAEGYGIADSAERELYIDSLAQEATGQYQNIPDDSNFNPDNVKLTSGERRKAIDIRKQIRQRFPEVAATGERGDSYAELLTAVQNVVKYAKTYKIKSRGNISLNRYADDVFEDYMFRSFRDRADISEEEEIFANEMKKQTLRYNDYYKEAFGPKESYDRRADSFKYKPGAYMGFNAARNRVRGAIELSQSRGAYADQLWEELKDLCPGMFPYEDVVNPQDQFRMILDRLGDIRDKMRDGIPFNETEAYEREGEDSVFDWVWDMTEITVNGLIRENTKGAQRNGRSEEAQQGRDQSESRSVSERTSGESGRDRAEDQGNVRPESAGEQLAQKSENGNEIAEGQVDNSTGREAVSDQSQNQQNNEVNLTPRERAQETARNASAKRKAEIAHKTEQFEILQNSNPMRDDIHTGIRNVNDIKTAQEVFGDEDEFIGTPDWTFRDAQFALENGTVTIYSSNAIVDGAFVTPSKMIAQDYAGTNRDVNSTVVSLDDVAWIDSNEGQLAPINTDSQQDVIVEETSEEETSTKEFQFVPWQWYNVSVRNTKTGKADDLGTMTSYKTQKQIEGYTYNGTTFENPRDPDYVYEVEPAEWTDQQKPLIEKYGEFDPNYQRLTQAQEERVDATYLYLLDHPVATMVEASDERACKKAIGDILKFKEHIDNSNRIALKQYANKRISEFLYDSNTLDEAIDRDGVDAVTAYATDFADEVLNILNENDEAFEETKRYVGMSEAAEPEQNEPPARMESRTSPTQPTPVQASELPKSYLAGQQLDIRTKAKEKEREARSQINPKEIKKIKKGGISGLINDIQREFNIRITTAGKMNRGELGYYEPSYQLIHTKLSNALGVAIHELGHHLDKIYKFNENQAIENMLNNTPKFSNRLSKVGYREDEKIFETVAEFLWQYMTNPDGAYHMGKLAMGNSVNENFYDTFEKTLSKEDLQRVQNIRSRILAYYGVDVTAADRVRSSIKSQDEVKKERKKQLVGDDPNPGRTAFLTNYVNFATPFIKLTENIEDAAGPLSETDRLDMSLNMAARYGTEVDAMLRRGGAMKRPDGTIDHNHTSFGDIFKSLEKDLKELYKAGKITKEQRNDGIEYFEAYLKSKHSIDWEKRGLQTVARDLAKDMTGNAVKDAIAFHKEAIDELDSIYGKTFEDHANKLYLWWNNFMKTWAVDTGLVPEELYEKCKKINPHYIPMKRVMENGKFAPINRKDPKIYKRAKGSAKDTYSPIESMMGMVAQIVKLHHKNQLGWNIARLYDHPNDDVKQLMAYHIDEVDPAEVKQTVHTGELKNTIRTAIVQNLTQSELAAFNNMTAKQQEDFIDRKANFNIDDVIGEVITEYTTSWEKKGEEKSVILARDENTGETRAFEFIDPNMMEALTMLDPGSQNKMLKNIGKFTRFYSAMLTSKNPFFAARNAMRDLQHAFIMDGDPAYLIRYGQALGQAIVNEFKSQHGMKVNDTYLQTKASLGYGSKYYAGRGDIDINETAQNVLQKSKSVLLPIHELVRLIETLNGGLEMAPRMAAYKKAYDQALEQGKTNEEAYRAGADAARNVTVDFGAKGTQIRDVGNVIPFIGVSIAGIKQTQEVFASKDLKTEEGKKRVIRALVSQTLPAILLSLLYGLKDDDKEDYEAISDYLKNNYWEFKIGNQWYRIPKDREYSAIWSTPIQLGIRLALGDDMPVETAEQFGSYLLNTFLPAHEWAFSAINQGRNNKSWYGSEIFSSSRYEEFNVPDYYAEITDEQTSDLAELLARGISHLPDPVQRDLLGGLSTPKGIDYLIDQMFGAGGDIVLALTTPTKGLPGLVDMLAGQYKTNPDKSNRYVNQAYEIMSKLNAEKALNEKNGTEMPYSTSEWQKVFQNTLRASSGSDPQYRTLGDYNKEIRELADNTTLTYKQRQTAINYLKKKEAAIASKLVKNYKNRKNPTISNYGDVRYPEDVFLYYGTETGKYARDLALYNRTLDKLEGEDKTAKQFAIVKAPMSESGKQFFSKHYADEGYDSYKDTVKGWIDAGLDETAINSYKTAVKDKGLTKNEEKILYLASNDKFNDTQKDLLMQYEGIAQSTIDSYKEAINYAKEKGIGVETYLDFNGKIADKGIKDQARAKAILIASGNYTPEEKDVLYHLTFTKVTDDNRKKYVNAANKAAEQGITPEEFVRVKDELSKLRYKKKPIIRSTVESLGYSGEKARALCMLYNPTYSW